MNKIYNTQITINWYTSVIISHYKQDVILMAFLSWSVIRQKGESLNEGKKETKHAKFS